MSIALFEYEKAAEFVTLPGRCLCGGELPRRPAYRTPACHCSYWCRLVEDGPEYYTLETIASWLVGNRPTSDAARSRYRTI